MISRRIWIAMILGACLSAAPLSPAQAQEKDVVVEGQVKIGQHKFKLEAGILYQFEVTSKAFSPNVILQGGFLQNRADFFKERNTFRSTFLPTRSAEHTLIILPNTFGANVPAGLLDYSVTLKAMKLDEKAILSKEDKIADTDPRLEKAFRKTHFKAYAINLKKGQTYIIDMKRVGNNNRLDPYLLIENPQKQVIAQDDDGGGFPHARILLQPVADGEYTIIATGLSDFSGFGEYALTVRTVKTEK